MTLFLQCKQGVKMFMAYYLWTWRVKKHQDPIILHAFICGVNINKDSVSQYRALSLCMPRSHRIAHRTELFTSIFQTCTRMCVQNNPFWKICVDFLLIASRVWLFGFICALFQGDISSLDCIAFGILHLQRERGCVVIWWCTQLRRHNIVTGFCFQHISGGNFRHHRTLLP
jgi:hypothetical protein